MLVKINLAHFLKINKYANKLTDFLRKPTDFYVFFVVFEMLSIQWNKIY